MVTSGTSHSRLRWRRSGSSGQSTTTAVQAEAIPSPIIRNGVESSWRVDTTRVPRSITRLMLSLLGISTCIIYLIGATVDQSFERDDDGANFTTDFVFPSPEARFKYYMGDWYGKTLQPNDIPCDEIVATNEIRSDESVLWRAGAMKREIKHNSHTDWLVSSYLIDAFDVMNSTGRIAKDDQLILYIGDSHSHSKKVPAVAKTRFSRFARSRRSGRQQFFNPIIFPLEMGRHYDPIAEYIKLHKQGKVAKWNDKKSSLIWRGAVTDVQSEGDGKKDLLTTFISGGSRIHVVRQYFNARLSDVDIAFEQNSPTREWAPLKYYNEVQLARGRDTSMADQLTYKYILNLEGNDIATGLKWQLASNSVVFMAKPTTVSFLMEDLLVPFVHYIPVNEL